MEQKKDIWDKVKNLSTITATLIIPIVLIIIGNEYTTAIKESENSLKYTELAIEILNNEPDDSNKNIRIWAIELINKYSGVDINNKAKSELIENNITTQVDELIIKKYAPFQINRLVESLWTDKEWREAINNKDSIEINNIMKMLLQVTVEEVLDYSKTLKNSKNPKSDIERLNEIN